MASKTCNSCKGWQIVNLKLTCICFLFTFFGQSELTSMLDTIFSLAINRQWIMNLLFPKQNKTCHRKRKWIYHLGNFSNLFRLVWFRLISFLISATLRNSKFYSSIKSNNNNKKNKNSNNDNINNSKKKKTLSYDVIWITFNSIRVSPLISQGEKKKISLYL